MDKFVEFLKDKGYIFVCNAFSKYYEKPLLQHFTIQVAPSYYNFEVRLMKNHTRYFCSIFDYRNGERDFINCESEFLETAKNIIKINMENEIKKDFV